MFKQDLGLSNKLGLAFAAFNYTYAPFQLIGGWIADRFGARRTLTVWPGLAAYDDRDRRGDRACFIVCRTLRAGNGRGCHLAGGYPSFIELDRTRGARPRCWPDSRSGAVRGGRIGIDRCFPDHLVLLAFLPRRNRGGVSLPGQHWSFHEDPSQHPGITSAVLAALRGPHPARRIASGPVPWRRLIPRMVPMMIGYFCQGWTGWLCVTWMPSLFAKNYGMDLKNSPLFYAVTLLCSMFAEFFGGATTDYLFCRTGNLRDRAFCTDRDELGAGRGIAVSRDIRP